MPKKTMNIFTFEQLIAHALSFPTSTSFCLVLSS